MDIKPLLSIHLLMNKYLGCFNFLAIMNNAAMNIYVQAFVSLRVFIDFGCISMSGIVLTPCLTLGGTGKQFSEVAA